MTDLARRRDVAAAIAVEAAALAQRLRAEGGGVASLKGAQDFVTEADGATERFIRDRLARDFPGEAVLGEEMGGAADGAGPLWVVDPIDGTSNFARGGDRWCVSIGLVMGGRAVAGAIARHAPAEVFAAPEPPRPGAGAGSGAFWIYGQHAVLAALSNPRRKPRRPHVGCASTPGWHASWGWTPSD